MKITFLGTGTSQGVPVIACECEVCTSPDTKDNRLRTSILVETEDRTVVIDSGPDFRYQMLRRKVKKLDAIVFTHEHKDHIAGLDDVRAFNYRQQKDMDVYARPEVQQAIIREFSYIFAQIKYPGIPRVNLIEIDHQPFKIGKTTWIPVEVMHYKLPVLGFRIGDFTYITDAKTIAPDQLDKIRGSRVLVLNALQQQPHISHFTLEEAIALAKEVNAENTYFTHISHLMGKHQDINSILPEGMELAYDGLTLDID